MTINSKILAAIALALAPLGACAVVQEKTIGESLDDASASSQIKSRLLAAGASHYSQVDVEVTGRLALLTGRVATEDDRLNAERIAWSVRTVDEVANEIEVMEKSSLLTGVNDEWITGRVRARLLGDASIRGVNYNIETFNGGVYLLGLARSDEELRRAAEHASLVKGVSRVVSYVKLRDRELPDYLLAETPQQGAAPIDGSSAPPRNYAAAGSDGWTDVPLPSGAQKSSSPAGGYADPYGDSDGETLSTFDSYQDLAGAR